MKAVAAAAALLILSIALALMPMATSYVDYYTIEDEVAIPPGTLRYPVYDGWSIELSLAMPCGVEAILVTNSGNETLDCVNASAKLNAFLREIVFVNMGETANVRLLITVARVHTPFWYFSIVSIIPLALALIIVFRLVSEKILK